MFMHCLGEYADVLVQFYGRPASTWTAFSLFAFALYALQGFVATCRGLLGTFLRDYAKTCGDFAQAMNI